MFFFEWVLLLWDMGLVNYEFCSRYWICCFLINDSVLCLSFLWIWKRCVFYWFLNDSFNSFICNFFNWLVLYFCNLFFIFSMFLVLLVWLIICLMRIFISLVILLKFFFCVFVVFYIWKKVCSFVVWSFDYWSSSGLNSLLLFFLLFRVR